ncbi:MAG: class I SAM-dependent methyltransferase [Planctomycetes bacterium]|nr:class I SAM-dependent methyltransferase [Planctomycetota bacterium]
MRVARMDELFTIVDKSRVRRVVDVGCHRGEHIAKVLKVHFPSVEIVGVEPKRVNYEACCRLGIENVRFVRLDCRALGRENVGVFDFVWCFGLIYHLDDPTQLIRALDRITNDRSWVCVEGHVAIPEEQASLPEPNPPIETRALDGRRYEGKVFEEFDQGAAEEERERLHQAALDNPTAFWLTVDSLLRMCEAYGFRHAMELRSSSADSPLGPGLVYPPVDPVRPWSRRLFLVSKSPLEPGAGLTSP